MRLASFLENHFFAPITAQGTKCVRMLLGLRVRNFAESVSKRLAWFIQQEQTFQKDIPVSLSPSKTFVIHIPISHHTHSLEHHHTTHHTTHNLEYMI